MGKALIFFILVGLFLSAGLPFWVDLPVAALFLVAARKIKTANLVLVAVSMALGLGLVEATVRLLPTGPQGYYRPHERFWDDQRKLYQPRVDVRMTMPHGDLIAFDPLVPASLRQPRQVRFKTDSLGFRNEADYCGQKIILAGDSFVVGNGSDQAQTLPPILRRNHGLEVYSLACPGDPRDYCQRIKDLLDQVEGPVKVLMFIFEGNDFKGPGRPLDRPHLYDRLKMAFIARAHLAYPRYLFNLSRRAQRLVYRTGREQVEVYQVGGQAVGFLGSYVNNTLFDQPQLLLDEKSCPPALASRLAAVYFVPTKYRVYFDLLEDNRGRILTKPAPAFVAVKRFFEPFGLPVLDLTPALSHRAKELLSQGR
ncbi:MAG: hypothetical protein JRJ59_09945, partial [Deltaproteobacteria bacterium]|nr:hypothetical protein [Deltaproteobacteria bacterium]